MADFIAVIGAGPAGLIAAELLSAAGKRVIVFERMPSVARKFLIAGRGGLNLTHSEALERFTARYGEAAEQLRPILDAFTPADLIAWAEALGQETFIGSSGRVFPKAMKASPLLRAWLQRLAAQGVEMRTRAHWTGWDEHGALIVGNETLKPAATVLALGGASWPRLGSDGAWSALLAARGVALAPFKPANVGFEIAWSEHMRARFAGEALKGVAISHDGRSARGDLMLTEYGIEGGAIYALSAALRDALADADAARISIDLRPDITHAALVEKLQRSRHGDSLSNTLRKAVSLSPATINVLREAGPPPSDPDALAARIKAVPLTLTAPRGLERAISTAGGVAWDAVDANLELKTLPGVYAVGEMLDWEAPTGGYLLQACFATGVQAARAILAREDLQAA